MKPEQALWQWVGPLVKAYGHFERVENAFGSGMPDVTFCVNGIEGWLELKARDRWPMRADDPVTISHYTPQQRRWARRRAKHGGNVKWLLRVTEPQHEYVLLDGVVAAALYEQGPPTGDVLVDCALWHFQGKLTRPLAAGLIRGLTDQTALSRPIICCDS